MDPSTGASKSTPFGKPAARLQKDGASAISALAPVNNLLSDKVITETTVYERQISFRVKSETKDGQLVLHQNEEQLIAKVNIETADHQVLQSLTLELFSPIDVFFHYSSKINLLDFSQLKNEGKLHVQFEEFEGYLVDLLNKSADRAKGRVFGEITIFRHEAVGLELFEKAGLKVVSLFKRDFYPLSPLLIHRKVNSMVTHEAEEVDRLEQYILNIWTMLQDKSPQLYKELQAKNLGPQNYTENVPSRSVLNSKVETRPLTAVEISQKQKRENSKPKIQKSSAELTFGAPLSLTRAKPSAPASLISVSTVNKPVSRASGEAKVQKLLQPQVRQGAEVKKAPAVVEKRQVPVSQPEKKQTAAVQPAKKAPLKGIMKSPSLKVNKSEGSVKEVVAV